MLICIEGQYFYLKFIQTKMKYVLDYIVSQYSYVNIYFIKIRMHSFRNYFIPLCIVSRYFMYLRDSWFFVFVFFPCENWVIRFGFVISHALQIYTVKLQWKRDTCKKCTLYKYLPYTVQCRTTVKQDRR